MKHVTLPLQQGFIYNNPFVYFMGTLDTVVSTARHGFPTELMVNQIIPKQMENCNCDKPLTDRLTVPEEPIKGLY